MRKIECPYCKGEVLSEQNGRTTSSQTLFPRLQNVITGISDVISSITAGPKTVSKKEAIGGKCETCGDTGYIDDVTDTSEQDQAAADYLKSKADRILELESGLGKSPGGNMVSRIAGVKIDIIGRTFNSADSYTVHEGKGADRYGVRTKQKGRAAVPVGPKKDEGGNVITGNNVPANTGGGLYYIQCGNKFKLVAGAQGIDITSKGPINIDGGMVRFTGAEVTLGSNKGRVVIGGDQLDFSAAKSIVLGSGIGGVGGTDAKGVGGPSIQGCGLFGTNNLQAGGAYIDNLYFANATCPEKQESSKISSPTDLVTGPAQWTPNLPAVTLKNFLKWVTDSTTDIILAGAMNPLNPRSALKTKDNIVNLIYSTLPQELVPTGYAVASPGPPPVLIPVFNYPHVHTMPDEPHSHDYTVPAITYTGRTAESVRAEFDAAGGNTSVPAAAAGGAGDLRTRIVSGLTGAFKVATGLFASDGHKVTGGTT